MTVRDEQRNKLEQMAALEKRSVSNLIQVMTDERWEKLVEQQGVAYANTIAGAMNLKLDMDNPADREKLRRAILESCRREKNAKAKRAWLKFSPKVVGIFFLAKGGGLPLPGMPGCDQREWNGVMVFAVPTGEICVSMAGIEPVGLFISISYLRGLTHK